jgi:hypothetical protein
MPPGEKSIVISNNNNNNNINNNIIIEFLNIYHITKKKKNDLYDRGGHLDELCEGAMWEGSQSTAILNNKTKEVFFSYWLLSSIQSITVS